MDLMDMSKEGNMDDTSRSEVKYNAIKTKYGRCGSKTLKESIPIINKQLLRDTCTPIVSNNLVPSSSLNLSLKSIVQ